MTKKSSYQKLKDKIKELEQIIYNMAQDDDEMVSYATMQYEKDKIKFIKSAWVGSIERAEKSIEIWRQILDERI